MSALESPPNESCGCVEHIRFPLDTVSPFHSPHHFHTTHLQQHGELGVSVWHVCSLLHERRDDVAQFEQTAVDVLCLCQCQSGRVRLVDPFAARQIAQCQFATRDNASRSVFRAYVDDEQAVRAGGVGVDVVAPSRTVLKATCHDFKYLLW